MSKLINKTINEQDKGVKLAIELVAYNTISERCKKSFVIYLAPAFDFSGNLLSGT